MWSEIKTNGGGNIEITINGDVYIYDGEKKTTPKLRTTNAVKNAKNNVKIRDDCCQCCGEHNKILEVHHIMPISKYPNLASDTSNLIALCQHCHKKYHDTYEGAEGADTFAKFMRDYSKKW